jgi:4-carboxymuconolactone decarboxylase
MRCVKTGGNQDGPSRNEHDASDSGIEWPDPPPPRRVAPIAPEDRTPEVEELLGSLRIRPDQPVGNIFATLAHHPRLLKRWSAFGGVLLFRGELDPRERELLILRTAWNCRAHYEWGHHVPMAQSGGLDDTEIARVKAGPSADGWNERDTLLLTAADELHTANQVSDATWAGLEKLYNPAQLIEICMVVGQYHLVAFTLNSLGVQLEELR